MNILLVIAPSSDNNDEYAPVGQNNNWIHAFIVLHFLYPFQFQNLPIQNWGIAITIITAPVHSYIHIQHVHCVCIEICHSNKFYLYKPCSPYSHPKYRRKNIAFHIISSNVISQYLKCMCVCLWLPRSYSFMFILDLIWVCLATIMWCVWSSRQRWIGNYKQPKKVDQNIHPHERTLKHRRTTFFSDCNTQIIAR